MESPGAYDERLRAAAFDHLTRLLDRSPDGALASVEINRFQFEGRTIRLVRHLEASHAERGTVYPDGVHPAESAAAIRRRSGDDGLVRYKWRGLDPQHFDNRALRTAMQRASPLVYFVGVDRGVYVPRYPVWLVSEEVQRREFGVAVDEGQRLFEPEASAARNGSTSVG